MVERSRWEGARSGPHPCQYQKRLGLPMSLEGAPESILQSLWAACPCPWQASESLGGRSEQPGSIALLCRCRTVSSGLLAKR
jgi:hypothetical protein